MKSVTHVSERTVTYVSGLYTCKPGINPSRPADSSYGTGANYHELFDHGIIPYIPEKHGGHRKGQISKKAFVYDADNDCYLCPAGQTTVYPFCWTKNKPH